MPVFLPTLKARIALITTVLAAVFGSGIVLTSLYAAHRDLHDVLQDEQDSIVKLSADQLDTAMEDRIMLLRQQAGQLSGRLGGRPARKPTRRWSRRWTRSGARYRSPARSTR